MLSSAPYNIQILITKLLIDQRYKQALQRGHQKYQIRQFKIESLTPNQIFCMYYCLSTKFYCKKASKDAQSWYENELRIFIWLLVGYSFLQDKCISKLTQQDWRFFSEVFNNRSHQILEFQGLSILKKQVKFLKWSSQQIKLLDTIIKSKKIKNKWNQIAKDLFLMSQKQFFRTAKQCRQYWINHLDPNPIRSEWEPSQDLELIKTVIKIGKKWAKVSKIFGGKRTEHMVKNRFKSLIQAHTKQLQDETSKNLNQEQLLFQLQKKLNLAWITLKNKPTFQTFSTKQNEQVTNQIKTSVDFSSAEGCPTQAHTDEQMQNQQTDEVEQMICEQDELLKFTTQTLTMNSFKQMNQGCVLLPMNKKEENFRKYFNQQDSFHQ